jgi:hypothetical protein
MKLRGTDIKFGIRTDHQYFCRLYVRKRKKKGQLHVPVALPLRRELRYPLTRWLNKSRSVSGGTKKILFFLPRIESLFLTLIMKANEMHYFSNLFDKVLDYFIK